MGARRRWIAIGLGVVLVLLAAGYAGASYLVYDKLADRKPLCADEGGPRFQDYTPAAFGTAGISAEFTTGGFDTKPYAMPGYREVVFPSLDPRRPTLTIRAWWVPAAAAGAPAVVVVHGIGSCRRDPVVLLPAGMLVRNGVSVLMMDMRDAGDSDVEDGRVAWGTEEYLDVLGAWDWLQSSQGIAAGRIGLLGESLGAGTAIIAMAEQARIAATWADSAFSDVTVMVDDNLAESGMPTWLDGGAMLWARILGGDDLTSYRPLDAVERIGARPIAIVHGLADDVLDVRYARDLAAIHARFVPGFEPWLVPRALHLQAAFAEPVEYERRLVEFFRANLGA